MRSASQKTQRQPSDSVPLVAFYLPVEPERVIGGHDIFLPIQHHGLIALENNSPSKPGLRTHYNPSRQKMSIFCIVLLCLAQIPLKDAAGLIDDNEGLVIDLADRLLHLRHVAAAHGRHYDGDQSVPPLAESLCGPEVIRTQDLGNFRALVASENPDQGVAQGNTLFDRHSDDVAHGEASAIPQDVPHAVGAAEHRADCYQKDQYFKETQNGSPEFLPFGYHYYPDGANGNIADSCKKNKERKYQIIKPSAIIK